VKLLWNSIQTNFLCRVDYNVEHISTPLCGSINQSTAQHHAADKKKFDVSGVILLARSDLRTNTRRTIECIDGAKLRVSTM
jgi:hypothetical protein